MLSWKRKNGEHVRFTTYTAEYDRVTYKIQPFGEKERILLVKSLYRERNFICGSVKSAKEKAERIASDNEFYHTFS